MNLEQALSLIEEKILQWNHEDEDFYHLEMGENISNKNAIYHASVTSTTYSAFGDTFKEAIVKIARQLQEASQYL